MLRWRLEPSLLWRNEHLLAAPGAHSRLRLRFRGPHDLVDTFLRYPGPPLTSLVSMRRSRPVERGASGTGSRACSNRCDGAGGLDAQDRGDSPSGIKEASGCDLAIGRPRGHIRMCPICRPQLAVRVRGRVPSIDGRPGPAGPARTERSLATRVRSEPARVKCRPFTRASISAGRVHAETYADHQFALDSTPAPGTIATGCEDRSSVLPRLLAQRA
jgi:hypothetical protein